jgi:hypothetical protein
MYPAGWYPDGIPGQLRYWDGEQWTQYVTATTHKDGGTWREHQKLPKFRPSAQLVNATYRMVFEAPSTMVLLLVGTLVATAAAAGIMFSATHWGHVTPGWSQGGLLGVLVVGAATGAATFVIQLVSGAVVATAVLRAEGRPVSTREALRLAWARRRQLLAWALVSTLVGVLIRAIERMGLGGVLAAVTLNVGWAFATVFAAPVIIVEGTMPTATLRRSADLLRRHFTVTLASGVTLALPWIALAVGSVVVGTTGAAMLVFSGAVSTTVVGVILCVVGTLGLLAFVVVSSALSAFLSTFLYRYAIGLPIPGVDPRWLPPLRPM